MNHVLTADSLHLLQIIRPSGLLGFFYHSHPNGIQQCAKQLAEMAIILNLMAEIDWHRCRFLESTENLKPLVQKRFGREPSTSIAREITACLQQGRLFYEAGISSPLEIRPLQLFYGMVSFSKALVLAHRLRALSTLKPTHGIKDISTGCARIAGLALRIENAGNFQDFNDVMAELTRICYADSYSKPHVIYLPSAKSHQLCGIELSLQEILSRVPGLESLYRMTFGEDAKTSRIGFQTAYQNEVSFQLSIEDSRLFSDRESLKQIVDLWRDKFPFLKAWRFTRAYHGYSKSHLCFENMSNSGMNEFSELYLIQRTEGLFEQMHPVGQRFPIKTGLDSVASGYGGGIYAISPVRDLYLSEFSLQYLALFLLSSLVRYRPQIWMHAISRSSISQAPADDQMLSLIERFLSLNSTSVPDMVVTVLNPYEDYLAS